MKFVVECDMPDGDLGYAHNVYEYTNEEEARAAIKPLRKHGAVYIRVTMVKDVTASFLVELMRGDAE